MWQKRKAVLVEKVNSAVWLDKYSADVTIIETNICKLH